MWLVVISHTMDDIPLAVFHTGDHEADKLAALKFIESVQLPEYGFAPDCPNTAYWPTDASTPVCVQLIELAPLAIGEWRPFMVKAEKSFDNEDTDYPGNSGNPIVSTSSPHPVTDGRDPILTDDLELAAEIGGEA